MLTKTALTTEGLLTSHTCTGVAVRCIDFRFRNAADQHLTEMLETFDGPIAWAGGARIFTQEGPGRDAVLEQLAVSYKLHKDESWDIVLMAHTDCGAYKLAGFTDPQEQRAQQEADLVAARAFLKGQFPEADVHCLIAVGDGGITFIQVN